MKVLILCYDFPPLISIGGQRPYSWFRYLPESGVSATVITRHWQSNISEPSDYVNPTSAEITFESDSKSNTVIRVPFVPNLRDRLLLQFGYNRFVVLRKFLSLIYTFFEFLFFYFDSRVSIYREAEKQIALSKPDYIIATGEPFILFKYAHLLAAKHKIKWVADYRDSWTGNQGNYKKSLLQKIQRSFFKALEQKYLGNAFFITTAAPVYARELEKVHPGNNVHVIFNGFDEQYFQNIEDIETESEKFVITYAGILYPHQNLEMFLDGLDQFITAEKSSPKNFEVRFYGLDGQPLGVERLMNYRKELMPFIKLLPKIPYSEIVKKIRSSHVLLLLSRSGAEWLNAKVFDYLAAKRKILLVENDKGVLKNLLDETDGGFAANNANEVAAFLKLEFENFRNGKPANTGGNDNYKKYSRGNQAAALAWLLKSKAEELNS